MNIKNSQIKSFSSELAIQFLKDQGMNSIQSIQHFAKALDKNFMQYYEDNFDTLVSKYEPDSYIRELKKDSEVCAKIYLSKAYLDFYNIGIDKALKTIEALLHCPHINNKTFNILPTMYLSIRVGLSCEKINAIFMLCETLDLVILKKDSDNRLYYKFTTTTINDCWLKERQVDFEYSNIKAFNIAYYEKHNLYHCGISIETFNRNIKRNIIEITLAFNHLINTDPVLRQIYSINGTRLDIIYATCPVELIAFMLKVSIKKVREELNKLCNKTNFIAKHDKVYIDSYGKNHYTNSEYKWFNKIIVDENTILEEGHPPVDENSIIWFSENLEKSKYYKQFKKNKNNIIERTKSALLLYTLKSSFYNEVKEEVLCKEEQKLEKEDIEKCEAVTFNGYGSIVTLDRLKQIENPKFNPTIYNKLTLDNMNVPKLIKALKKTMYSLVNCKRNALNYLIRQKNYIGELIKEKIYTYSRDTNYKQALQWKEEIEYLTSNQNPNESVLYEYIEVPLYITVKDSNLAMLASIRI